MVSQFVFSLIATALVYSLGQNEVQCFQLHKPFSRPASLSHQYQPTTKSVSLNTAAAAAAMDLRRPDRATRLIDDMISQQVLLEEFYDAKVDLERVNAMAMDNDVTLRSGEMDASFTDTAARSVVKSMMWRVIAGSVTFVTSLRFSGSLSTALSIVGSDFFSKAATMFVGERLMNKSQAGRKSGSDDVGRSLVKALIWRLFAICTTLTTSFVIAGNLSMASKIAGSDAIFKTSLMFFYERMWAKIEWGKELVVAHAV